MSPTTTATQLLYAYAMDKKGHLMDELIICGETYTSQDPPLRLLEVLRRYLDKTLLQPESIELTDSQVFLLKSWLLLHAEKMRPGKAVWIEESTRDRNSRLVVAIGKTDEGMPIVWHDPLPWPFDFGDTSKRIL
jgi:hypothetical protein